MAIEKKSCRVCGNLYEACRSVKKNLAVFNWQEVACSPECGAVYLQRINESRGLTQKPKLRGKRAKTTADEFATVEDVDPNLQGDKSEEIE